MEISVVAHKVNCYAIHAQTQTRDRNVVYLDGYAVTFANNFKYLGVIFGRKHLHGRHVEHVVKNCSLRVNLH